MCCLRELCEASFRRTTSDYLHYGYKIIRLLINHRNEQQHGRSVERCTDAPIMWSGRTTGSHCCSWWMNTSQLTTSESERRMINLAGGTIIPLWLGMSRSDYVIGNRARSRGFRLDRNRTLPPDQDSDIYVYIFSLFFNTSIVMRWHRVRPLDSTRKQQRVRHDITLLQRRYWLNAGVVPKSADYASPRWNRTRLPNPNPTPNPNTFPTPTPKPTNTRGCIIWQAAEFGTTPAK